MCNNRQAHEHMDNGHAMHDGEHTSTWSMNTMNPRARQTVKTRARWTWVIEIASTDCMNTVNELRTRTCKPPTLTRWAMTTRADEHQTSNTRPHHRCIEPNEPRSHEKTWTNTSNPQIEKWKEKKKVHACCIYQCIFIAYNLNWDLNIAYMCMSSFLFFLLYVCMQIYVEFFAN